MGREVLDHNLGQGLAKRLIEITLGRWTQVRNLIAEGVAKTKVKTSDFRFKPAKGWLGGEVTEKLGGWKTRVYEVSNQHAPHIIPFPCVPSITIIS